MNHESANQGMPGHDVSTLDIPNNMDLFRLFSVREELTSAYVAQRWRELHYLADMKAMQVPVQIAACEGAPDDSPLHDVQTNEHRDAWCGRCGERLLLPGYAGGLPVNEELRHGDHDGYPGDPDPDGECPDCWDAARDAAEDRAFEAYREEEHQAYLWDQGKR